MDVSAHADRIIEKLRHWLGDLIALLPNVAVAVVVFVAFVLGSKLVRKLVHEGLARVSKNVQVNELLASTARLILLVIGLFVALGVLGLDKTVTSLLAGVGVIGLALGFAFKDIAANYMSGVIIAVRVPFDVGDLVKVQDYFGTVFSLDLRATGIRAPSGELIFIPNQSILENPIVNYSRSGERRVDLEVGVSYGDDLEKVRSVTLEAVQGISERDGSRDVELYFTGFGDSSIDYVVRFWIDDVGQSDFLAAQSAAVLAIKKAYDENDITIPFPIRTLDFGIVGGEKLDEVLVSARQELDNGGARRRPSSPRPS